MTEQLRHALAILRRKQVECETGLSRSTIYQRIKEGTFPAPIHLGPKAVGWRTGDIDRWLADPAAFRAEVNDAAPANLGHKRAACMTQAQQDQSRIER